MSLTRKNALYLETRTRMLLEFHTIIYKCNMTQFGNCRYNYTARMNAKARQTMEDKTNPQRWEYWIVVAASPAELPLSRPLVRMHTHACRCVFMWHPPNRPVLQARIIPGLRMPHVKGNSRDRCAAVGGVNNARRRFLQAALRRKGNVACQSDTSCAFFSSGTHPIVVNILERHVLPTLCASNHRQHFYKKEDYAIWNSISARSKR